MAKRYQKPKKKKKRKIGAPPGSLVFTGEQKLENPDITILQYNETIFEQVPCKGVDLPDGNPDLVTWYDIRGIHDINLIENIGHKFGIHTLVLEDILSPHQRPKFEEYDKGVFLIAKAILFKPEQLKIQTEQIAIFVSHNICLSFQEDADDVFLSVRERLENGRGKVRKRGADYLIYALLDNLVDHYFAVLDAIEEVIDDLEEEIINNPDNETKSKIHHLKREMLTLRKAVTPLREAINRFSKSENEIIQESSEIFIRDLYDHVVQVMDAVETYRDTLSGLQDLYISEISFKMNNVMQVLTIISSIFIPLSFLAGLYGMNFKYIPELEWHYGYFALLAVMVILVISLLFLFKRKKWM